MAFVYYIYHLPHFWHCFYWLIFLAVLSHILSFLECLAFFKLDIKCDFYIVECRILLRSLIEHWTLLWQAVILTGKFYIFKPYFYAILENIQSYLWYRTNLSPLQGNNFLRTLPDALYIRSPHHPGFWEYELLPVFVWASGNVEPTVLHWLFPDPHGDPIHTKIDHYSTTDLRKPCRSSEQSSFCGTLLRHGALQILSLTSQSSVCLSHSPQFSKPQGSVLDCTSTLKLLPGSYLGNYRVLPLFFPYPRSHCIVYSKMS